MTNKPEQKTRFPKACFGRWDIVFPMGADGLREVAPSCRECQGVKDCLAQAARTKDAVEMRVERSASAGSQSHGGGVVGFFRRWSSLKRMRRESE